MQFQVKADDIVETRLVDGGMRPALGAGAVRVRVDKFGLSANNVTYAAAGFTLGYWTFFPPHDPSNSTSGGTSEGWGVVPVWGFATVVESTSADIPVGERLFGYFPPAKTVDLEPVQVSSSLFVDGAAHRSELPTGYNVYRRVGTGNGFTGGLSEEHYMLLYPLYITSFALWDLLAENNGFGAKRIILTSASSKTSIGLAHGLRVDAAAPACLGLTSARNVPFVQSIELYDAVVSYDDIETLDASIPTAIVDMAGNGALLGQLHNHLGDSMVQTLQVGLTHWDGDIRNPAINRDRSTFFFAPSQIQKRMKDWGPQGFQEKSSAYLLAAVAHTQSWLNLHTSESLADLPDIYGRVCRGDANPEDGFVFTLN